jgi:hypothetical protein
MSLIIEEGSVDDEDHITMPKTLETLSKVVCSASYERK